MGTDKNMVTEPAAQLVSQIHIDLDSYDDIFSDFDQSPYSVRSLSGDFLGEVRERYAEKKSKKIEVLLSLPKRVRNLRIESVIKKRLKGYFGSRVRELRKKPLEKIRLGIVSVLIGLLFLAADVAIEYYSISDLLVRLFVALSIPIGWYALYAGFESIIASRKISKRLLFFEGLEKANYLFVNLEDIAPPVPEISMEQKNASKKTGVAEPAPASRIAIIHK